VSTSTQTNSRFYNIISVNPTVDSCNAYFYDCSFKAIGHPVIIGVIVSSSAGGFSLLCFDQFIFYQGILLSVLLQLNLINFILSLQKRYLSYHTEEDPFIYSDIRVALCNRYKAKVKKASFPKHES